MKRKIHANDLPWLHLESSSSLVEKMSLVVGVDGMDPENDNVDLHVLLQDGTRWNTTLITLKNIETLMGRWAETGECCAGAYCTSDHLILRELTPELIDAVVTSTLEDGSFREIFQQSCE